MIIYVVTTTALISAVFAEVLPKGGRSEEICPFRQDYDLHRAQWQRPTALFEPQRQTELR